MVLPGDGDPTQQHQGTEQDGDATKWSHPRPLSSGTSEHRKPGKGTSPVFLVLLTSSENLSPVLKQHKEAAKPCAQTGGQGIALEVDFDNKPR